MRIAWLDRLRYHFDNLMSRGTGAVMLVLFALTLVVVVVGGVLAWLFKPDGTGVLRVIWTSFNRALDPGYLEADSGSVPYMVVLSLVTIFGVLVTSVLIGLITAGVEAKMTSLRKGRSRVLARDHVVILGFNEATFTILEEFATFDEKHRGAVVVVMDERAKDEMEDAIRERLPNLGAGRVICRTGNIGSPVDLRILSLGTAHSILINASDDFLGVKAVLACNLVLDETPDAKAHITAVMHDQDNVTAARVAGGARAEILHFNTTIAKVIAHACRQPGISEVFTELFNASGHEIYVEPVVKLVAKTIAEANRYLPCSSVIGLVRGGVPWLNPPASTPLEASDRYIVVAEHHGTTIASTAPAPVDETAFATVPDEAEAQRLLVLGYSPLLYDILAEEDHYLIAGSTVTVAAPGLSGQEDLPEPPDFKNLKLRFRDAAITDPDVLKELLADNPENVLILADPALDDAAADARTLLVLMLLRGLVASPEFDFTITSEMRLIDNQELARVSRVNDFVVSSHLSSLITAQIARTRQVGRIFQDLLSAGGSEIYLRPVTRYLKPGAEVDFYTACAAAARFDEAFVGYRTEAPAEEGGFRVVVNPPKADRIRFKATDSFLVLAED
ncbi:MAG: hypothetical protein LBR58_02450 [Propionibacteriaceae bacterium]|jgi:K+/H+ antiporter YhaU regulatory subunit KhtT|nr:hypothetical protein [Propionibacteriaceae bacterium]